MGSRSHWGSHRVKVTLGSYRIKVTLGLHGGQGHMGNLKVEHELGYSFMLERLASLSSASQPECIVFVLNGYCLMLT